MKKSKLFAPVLAAIVSISFGSLAVAGGIPVIDAAHIATSKANQFETIAKWVQQLKDMQNQIKEMQTVWGTLKGGRNMGNLLRDDLVKQFLPEDYWSVAKALREGKGDWNGISGQLSDIVKANQFKSCSEINSDAKLRSQCEQRWRELATTKELGDIGYKKATENIKQLLQHVEAINTSTDQKTVSEIQARIGVEQVRMQNEMMKLDMMAKMEAAAAKMATQKKEDSTQAGLMTFERPNF